MPRVFDGHYVDRCTCGGFFGADDACPRHGEPRCSDCGGPGPLVTTRGGSRVCRDCYMGENFVERPGRERANA